MPASASRAKIIAISVNSCWNIVNFRAGLIRRLRDHGYRIVAIAPIDGYERALIAMGVEVVPIAIDSKGVSPVADLALFLAYRRALGTIRPAVFLGWTIKPNIWGSLAARSLRIPVVNNVSGLGTVFIRAGVVTAIVTRLYRLALRGSTRVFFQNADDCALFVEHGLVAAERATLLPGSGIDLERFAAVPLPERNGEDGPVFLLIARLLRDKGVMEFVAAARLVRRRSPGARFRLLGALDVANRTAIDRSEVEAWVAAGTVEYLGHTDDVRPAIVAADCVVLPSYREGLPRSLLEAAAMGRPLIATDVPGCRDVAREGENALLCAARDTEGLAAAMLTFADLPLARRQAMAQAGRRMAEREFDETIVGDRYLAAINAATHR